MLKRLKYIIILATLSGCAVMQEFDGGETSSDWTLFRGSSSLCGYTDRSLPDSPVLRWTYDGGGRTVASPIVYDGIIYTCDRKGVVRGIDEQGKLCFQYDLQSNVEASFIICDSVMYFGRIDGYLTALSLNTQKVKWEYETLGQISASPNIVGKTVVVGSYDSNLYTFDASSGTLRSTFSTGYYLNGAASVYGDYAVFGGCDAWLRMVNTRTGEAADSLELKAYIPQSPAIMGDKAYVSDYSGNLYEVSLAEGRFREKRELVSREKNDGEGGVVSMPTVSKAAVFTLTDDRYILCIDRKDGQEKWRRLLRGQTGESAPLVCRDKVLVCTKDGHVSILQASDGKELWHYDVGEQIISSPAVVGDGFYILTARGKLMSFR